MERNNKLYKLYLADVAKVHSITKKLTPVIPSFFKGFSTKLSEK